MLTFRKSPLADIGIKNLRRILLSVVLLVSVFIVLRIYQEVTIIREPPSFGCRSMAISLCVSCEQGNVTASECKFSKTFVIKCSEWCSFAFPNGCIEGQIIPCDRLGVPLS